MKKEVGTDAKSLGTCPVLPTIFVYFPVSAGLLKECAVESEVSFTSARHIHPSKRFQWFLIPRRIVKSYVFHSFEHQSAVSLFFLCFFLNILYFYNYYVILYWIYYYIIIIEYWIYSIIVEYKIFHTFIIIILQLFSVEYWIWNVLSFYTLTIIEYIFTFL